MAQSDRSSDPRRRRDGAPRKSGSAPRSPRKRAPPRDAPPVGHPTTRTSGRRAPPTRAPGAKRPKQDGRPTRRPAASAPTKKKRSDRPGPPRKGTPARPATRPEGAPKVTKPSLVRAALDWLLDEPADKKQRGPTEREKAIAAADARAEQERQRFLAQKLSLDRLRGDKGRPALAFTAGKVRPARASGPTPTDPRLLAGEAARARTDANPQHKDGSGQGGKGAKGDDRSLRDSLAAWAPVAFLLTKVLGEKRTEDDAGNVVYVPPAETDWRWNLHQFFRSQKRVFVAARTLLVLFLVLSAAWTSVYVATGYDLTEVAAGSNPDDPMSQYRVPFFIIESGSMMHHDAPFGRLGTVDPGDLVVLEKIDGRHSIETFYGPGERRVAGGKGDVIMFLPVTVGDEEPQPIIHRAMAYIEHKTISIPNPNAGPGQPPTVRVPRYTVEEFGIYEAQAVTIPELGLRNYRPPFSGFITRGDNVRTNNWADQASGIVSLPVPADRVLGRLDTEVPYVGLTKIALSGQDPRLINPDDQWCSFLAGQAACDTWIVFLAMVSVFVGVPLAWALLVFGRRAYHRHLDRLVLKARQDAEAQTESQARRDWNENAPELPVHGAVDLLSGRVVVEGLRSDTGHTAWRDLTATGKPRLRDDGT